MPKLNRRAHRAVAASGAAARGLPRLAKTPGGKRVLTLVYDKTLGAMRAVDRVVN